MVHKMISGLEVLYSGKLSREKTCANSGFTAVRKSFTMKFGGVASFCSTSEQSVKVSSAKVSHYTVKVRECTMSTKHLPPSLPFSAPISPQCCLHLQQATGSGLRDVRRRERSSGHCPCHHNCSAGGTPAGNWDHSGSGPRNNPHQLPWRETTCAPTRLIPS